MADIETTTATGPSTTGPIDTELRFWKVGEPDCVSDDSESSFGMDDEITLRDYQEDAVQACVDALATGLTRIGVSSPTGSGKTTMFTSLIPRVPDKKRRKQVLILVHTEELAAQAQKTVEQVHGYRYRVGVEQGGQNTDGRRDVTIATWQSLIRGERLQKFDPSRFKVVIIDEAHHASADSYLRIAHYFNNAIQLMGRMPLGPATHRHQVPIIGFSATFARSDEKHLIWMFEEIVYDLEIEELLIKNQLAPVVFRSAEKYLDRLLTERQVTGAPKRKTKKRPRKTGRSEIQISEDANVRAMTKVSQHPEFHKAVVATYQEEAADRLATLIFCGNLDSVDTMVFSFRAAGSQAKCITSKTEPEKRARILAQFKAGQFPVLVNCLVLTEGADMPTVDCIILARSTNSRNYFSQMVGRGLRLSPSTGKEYCLVLDLFGITSKFGLGVRPNLYGDTAGANNLEVIKQDENGQEQEVGQQEGLLP